MKSKLILMSLFTLLAAALAYAQPAQLELFADANMSSCSLIDAPGIVPVYVIHTGGEPSTGVQFSAPKPACWNATWLSETYPPNGGEFGNSQTAAQVAYGECRTPPALVLTMYFLSAGTTSSCCEYNTLDADIYVDCFQGLPPHEFPLGEGPITVTINPDESCPCMVPVSTESSTWGRVKALYR